MADVNAAIDYVLRFEDSTLSGAITEDEGGKTRFGIAELYHPELSNCLFYTSMGSTAALVLAKGIYTREYANPLCIAEIADQGIANKMLSLGVNIGISRAGKMLQSALGVPEDGIIGVQTLMKLSSADPTQVLNDLRDSAIGFYEKDVAENPELKIYLNGWLARARA